MSKQYIVIGILFWVMILCISFSGIHDGNQMMKKDGGPPYNTGAPSDKTCSGIEGASPCHSGGAGDNTGPATVSIDFGGGQTTYVPNQTYTVTASITRAPRTRFGFQILSLKNSNNANMGTVTITDTARTRSQIPTWGCCQTRNYVMHKNNGMAASSTNRSDWSYSWKAPSTNQGAITFYACFVAANANDTSDGGDEVYSTTLVINPSTVGIESSTEDEVIYLYPNPANEFLYIKYDFSKPCTVKSDLISIEGKFVQQLISECQLQGSNAEKIILNKNVAAGTYFVKTKIDDEERLQKIIIE